MPSFNARSNEKLETCHVDLQRLFRYVVGYFDCSVLCGHRGMDEQNALFHAKPPKTTLQWPDGKHNSLPSLAVDVAPFPINWNNLKRFYYFGGFVKGISGLMGIDIRWGGDWDSDTLISDQSFNDLPHFELVH